MNNSARIASSVRSALTIAVATTLAAMSGHALAADLETRRPFTIPPQSLSAALLKFSEQADIQIMTASADLAERTSLGATGDKTVREALELLLQGTGLKYRAISEDAIAIEPANAAEVKPVSSTQDSKNVRVAQASGTSTQRESTLVNETTERSTSDRSLMKLEEVVVTGSNIRGVQNLSSPIIRFDREQIEKGGFVTTQQLIHSLPQSLNSIADTTFGANNGGISTDAGYLGSGVNMRGLGADATLVLVNGRRLASGGDGSFVDLSMIPLGAIERVDVLTDGASAIYGSDAVGGVVNLVLRKDFEGAETRLRYGSVTEGSHSELQAGQMLGHSWDAGQALVTYEYFRRTPLDGDERDFVQPVPPWTEIPLVPRQARQGVLAMLSHRFSERVELSGDLYLGRRKSSMNAAFPTSLQFDSDVKQYGVSAAIAVDLARDWQVRLTGLFDQNESDMTERAAGFPDPVIYANESRLRSVDLAADGPLMRAPGGDVRLAMGAQSRHEDWTEEHPIYPARLDRSIAAAYAEVRVPWVTAANARRGLEGLELTVAARYEEYSDVGSSFNPKVGLAWAPLRGLNVRGTWGTSFKAPLLNQMNTAHAYAFVFQEGYRDVSGMSTVLALHGNGAGLRPEESKNWTAGFDFTPEALQDLSISATYFDIDYDQRIRTPFPAGMTLAECCWTPPMT